VISISGLLTKKINIMKALKLILTAIALFFVSNSMAQNDEGKRIEFQIKARTAFYSVDDRYKLLTDTIYHADDGFRVFSGYDVEKFNDGKEYVIFRYPKWSGKEQEKEKILFRNEELSGDSLSRLSEKEELNKPVHVDIVGRNALVLAIPKEQFDKLILEGKIDDVYSLKWKYSTKLASGFMTVPFKLRPKQDSVNFNITTDITLGAYIGVKKRISRKGNNFIVLPATLGLSYINVGNSETSNVNTKGNSSVVPGWTWSTGLLFDLNGFNVGVVLGQDFASGVGKNWLYNKKMWYSFSIGYSFFNKSDR
jgi:hypothetical protein